MSLELGATTLPLQDFLADYETGLHLVERLTQELIERKRVLVWGSRVGAIELAEDLFSLWPTSATSGSQLVAINVGALWTRTRADEQDSGWVPWVDLTPLELVERVIARQPEGIVMTYASPLVQPLLPRLLDGPFGFVTAFAATSGSRPSRALAAPVRRRGEEVRPVGRRDRGWCCHVHLRGRAAGRGKAGTPDAPRSRPLRARLSVRLVEQRRQPQSEGRCADQVLEARHRLLERQRPSDLEHARALASSSPVVCLASAPVARAASTPSCASVCGAASHRASPERSTSVAPGTSALTSSRASCAEVNSSTPSNSATRSCAASAARRGSAKASAS